MMSLRSEILIDSRWSRGRNTDLMETAIEDLLDVRPLKCHSLEVSLIVVVEEG